MDEIKKMHSIEGFQKCFDELLKANPYFTRTRVYEMLEEKHIEIFGERKYQNYQSFRGVRARLMKAKRI